MAASTASLRREPSPQTGRRPVGAASMPRRGQAGGWSRLAPMPCSGRASVLAGVAGGGCGDLARRALSVGGGPRHLEWYWEDFLVLRDLLRAGTVHQIVAKRPPLADARRARPADAHGGDRQDRARARATSQPGRPRKRATAASPPRRMRRSRRSASSGGTSTNCSSRLTPTWEGGVA